MTWIEISIAVAVAIFAVLSIYIIRTLLVLQQSLRSLQKQLETLSEETVFTLRSTEGRLKSFDPLLRTVAHVGDVVEERTQKIARSTLNPEPSRASRGELSREVLDWILASAQLYQTFSKKRS